MAAENFNMNPLLDKRLINAFIEGVVKTLSTMAQTEITTGKPTVETAFKPKGDIAGLVGMVAGSMKGTMSHLLHKRGYFHNFRKYARRKIHRHQRFCGRWSW
jgi:chemotaxis protein CheX